jgi:hypothetical protein
VTVGLLCVDVVSGRRTGPSGDVAAAFFRIAAAFAASASASDWTWSADSVELLRALSSRWIVLSCALAEAFRVNAPGVETTDW